MIAELVRLDIYTEVVSAIICFAIGHFSLRGYRKTGEKSLMYLYFGFIGLGIAMFFRGTIYVFLIMLVRQPQTNLDAVRQISIYSSFICGIIKIFSYGSMAYIFSRQAAQKHPYSALALFPFIFNPFIESISLILLLYISVQCGMNFLFDRETNKLLVLMGFVSLFLGHLLFLFSVAKATLYVAGEIFQLGGLASMLTMTIKVNKEVK